MKYTAIKNSEILIPRISFGCSNFGGIGSAANLVGKGDTEKDCHQMLSIAYSFGINHFDTASTYGAGNSEKILGKWLHKCNIPRDSAVISSKIGGSVHHRFTLRKRSGLSKKHINRELDLSLKRLRVNYLDLLYIHMPDPETPIEETLSTLNDAVVQGKVLKLGASNISLGYLKQSLEISRANSFAEYEVVQNEYNLINRKDEEFLIPFCKKEHILYIGYSPLSGGLLTGKYHKDSKYKKNTRLYYRSELYRSILTEKTFSIINSLNDYAKSIGLVLPTLMYAWLYDRSPVDSFLIGARNEAQFKSVKDAMKVKISDDNWKEIEKFMGDAKSFNISTI